MEGKISRGEYDLPPKRKKPPSRVPKADVNVACRCGVPVPQHQWRGPPAPHPTRRDSTGQRDHLRL